MSLSETFLKIAHEVGNFTRKKTGVNMVDAYFGPKEIISKRKCVDPKKLQVQIEEAIKETKHLENKLQGKFLRGQLTALLFNLKWLSGTDITYMNLLKKLFYIKPRKIPETTLAKERENAEKILTDIGVRGKDLYAKVTRWRKANQISEKRLEKEVRLLRRKTTKLLEMHRRRILSPLRIIRGGGITYTVVSHKPWVAYNCYQGNYTSCTKINRDIPHSRNGLESTLFHEVEHHIQNVCREYCYKTCGILEASIALLNSPLSVIDEGAADCSREFLGIRTAGRESKLSRSLSRLKRMASINAALMLNQDNEEKSEVINYLREEGLHFKPKSTIRFIELTTKKRKPNFWAPYTFSYYFGREKFILPALNKAEREGKLREFFRILYFNPYAHSTLTFKEALANTYKKIKRN